MRNYITTLRPWQWLKNVLIFIPYLLGNSGIDNVFFDVIAIFFLFSLFVSGTYIFNDIKDINLDKEHPVKKNRPIASGKISKENSRIFALVILAISLISSFVLNNFIVFYFLLYGITTFLYSRYFKYIYIFDTISISIMFLIRVLIGGAIGSISVTLYLGSFIFFVSCMLSLAKKISIINSKKITSANTFYNLLLEQNTKFSFRNIYLIFSVLSFSSLVLWLMNILSSDISTRQMFFLIITNILFLAFVKSVYTFSYQGLLEDFSRELYRNKYLFMLSLSIIISFSIGYYFT